MRFEKDKLYHYDDDNNHAILILDSKDENRDDRYFFIARWTEDGEKIGQSLSWSGWALTKISEINGKMGPLVSRKIIKRLLGD